LEVADEVANRIDDVLGQRTDALLVSWTNVGIDRGSGGAFERPFVILWVFGPDGRVTRNEMWDADRGAAALARFDELFPSPSAALGTSSAENLVPVSPAARIENAETRLGGRFAAAWAARDWEGIAALFAPEFRLIDRRRYAHLELDRDQHLESLRFRFEMRSSRTALEVIATRGRRLALTRQRFELAGGDVGPSETESLNVAECDERGHFVVLVTFAPDDLDAAYAELDERYAAGEGVAHAVACQQTLRFFRALAARDWEQLSAILTPEFVVEDHRPLGLLTSLSRDEYVASLGALFGLRPDATCRLEPRLAIDDQRVLLVARWAGGEAEGPFEIPVVNVADIGTDRARRYHFYTLDQLDEAWARFAALGTSGTLVEAHTPAGERSVNPSVSPLGKARTKDGSVSDPLAALAKPNAATVAMDRAEVAFEARDWVALRALCAADAKFEDRRRHVLVAYDVDGWIAERQRWARSAVLQERRLVGITGDRFALERVLATSGPAGGRSEIEYLLLTEVDAHGQIIALVAFDLDDRRAAHTEVFARSLAVDADA